ncbi:MAG: tetratricopeptide repeat protein, partial [Patescibacteria group bacterium]|nr:tetratricopeptide repeat protein [Patescibacteria group bacterium]
VPVPTFSTHGQQYIRKSGISQAALALLSASLLVTGCNNFDAQARNAEGVRMFQQARYHDALRHFQEANYADAKNVDAYYNLGATYHRLGVAERNETYLRQAENYYEMAVARNDDHPEAYRGLAVLLADQGRTQEAFTLLETWARNKPQSADAKVELARLCEEFGDRGNAEARLAEALALDPNSGRAWAALGRLREQQGDPAAALRGYERSLSQNRFQPEVAQRIAVLRSRVQPTHSIDAPTGGTRLVEQGYPVLR